MNNILQKSAIFYDVFERKPGTDKLTTTYCPGCGHGNLHKLIAEALVDFGVQDRTIFISPVGCQCFCLLLFSYRQYSGSPRTCSSRRYWP